MHTGTVHRLRMFFSCSDNAEFLGYALYVQQSVLYNFVRFRTQQLRACYNVVIDRTPNGETFMLQTTNLRMQRMERLLAVLRRLHQSDDLSAALQEIVTTACELTQSETSSILVYEEETGLLKFLAAPHQHADMILRQRIPLESSVAGYVYTKGEPLVINDAAADGRIFHRVDEITGYTTRSLLAVPLIYRQQTVGVLEVLNKKGGVPFTSDDADLLTMLAIQTATLIQESLLQEQAARTRQEMEDLERMKADFVAITSHELRTPLGLILGHASLLDEMVSDEAQREQIQVIINSARRLKKIVDDLSGMEEMLKNRSKIRREVVDVKDVIHAALVNLAGLALRKKVHLANRLPAEPIEVEGDREKIYIAVCNLVENGILFNNENGQVQVSAENLPGYVRVSVADNGIGIPAHAVHRIFEPFFQLEHHLTRRTGGMGLGLAVAKVMVELHGGQIWVESLEGKGSNFTFLLPKGTRLQNRQREAVKEAA